MNVQLKAKPTVNPLRQLRESGQAIWLDFPRPAVLSAEGGLKKLVEQDGLTGVTSNPSIFEKAIAGSADYDSSLKVLENQGDRDVMALYERLAIEDIRNAADALRPVYDATKRQDGYVSLEVSPYLAMNTGATVAEARRLWQAVGRDNLMIKVPATKAGLPAIRQLIGDGINVNITLLFSQQTYEEVVEAYQAGIEHLVAKGGDASKVASVASFFVSRIDVAVDNLIEERLRQNGADAALGGLRGKVAIANAKLAYQSYKRLFTRDALGGPPCQRRPGATPALGEHRNQEQELPRRAVCRGIDRARYGQHIPPATMDAFRDHGKVRASLRRILSRPRRRWPRWGARAFRSKR